MPNRSTSSIKQMARVKGLIKKACWPPSPFEVRLRYLRGQIAFCDGLPFSPNETTEWQRGFRDMANEVTADLVS